LTSTRVPSRGASSRARQASRRTPQVPGGESTTVTTGAPSTPGDAGAAPAGAVGAVVSRACVLDELAKANLIVGARASGRRRTRTGRHPEGGTTFDRMRREPARPDPVAFRGRPVAFHGRRPRPLRITEAVAAPAVAATGPTMRAPRDLRTARLTSSRRVRLEDRKPSRYLTRATARRTEERRHEPHRRGHAHAPHRQRRDL
jgi:hypothetical protein